MKVTFKNLFLVWEGLVVKVIKEHRFYKQYYSRPCGTTQISQGGQGPRHVK